MTVSSTTPRITSQPHELDWWAAVDHMLGDYLTDRGNKRIVKLPGAQPTAIRFTTQMSTEKGLKITEHTPKKTEKK